MRPRTKQELQFNLLNQIQDLGNAFQSSSTKFRLLTLLLHFIGCIAFLAFIPEPSPDRLGAIAPFVKPFLLSLITLGMPWTYLFATFRSDAFGQSFTNDAVDFSNNLHNDDLQSFFDTSEKADFFKRTRTELTLFPILSLVTGLFFITLLIWKLGAPILLGLLAIFLFNAITYLFLLTRMLHPKNRLMEKGSLK